MKKQPEGSLGDFSDAEEFGEGRLACGGAPWLKDLDAQSEMFSALIRDGKFAEADETLRAVDVANESTVRLHGYLIATFCARDKLPYRKEFYELVLAKMQGKRGWELDLLRMIK